MYELKSVNGMVRCLLRSGNDFVKTELPVYSAQDIVDRGVRVKSDRADYPICIGKRWYFEGKESVAPIRKKGGRKG